MDTTRESSNREIRDVKVPVIKQLLEANYLSHNREQSEACHKDTESFLKALGDKDPLLRDGVEKAIEFLMKFDRDSLSDIPNSRKRGELSVYHPILVSKMLFEKFGVVDLKVLQAAILHDVIEDVMEEKGNYFWTGGSLKVFGWRSRVPLAMMSEIW